MKKGIAFSLLLLLFALSVRPFYHARPDPALASYKKQLAALDSSLVLFKRQVHQQHAAGWKSCFDTCRYYYKMAEPVIAYYYSYAETRMNGPAVLEVEPSDFSEINYPTGFQVMEEQLFGDEPVQPQVLIRQLDYLLNYVHLLQRESDQLRPTVSDWLDICKTGLYAMAAKGLSGFDSPVALKGIQEATITLDAVAGLLALNEVTDARVRNALQSARRELEAGASGFETFDRAAFFSGSFRHLLEELHRYQQEQHIPFATRPAAVRTSAESFFARDAFDPWFFAPDSAVTLLPERIALGKRLFSDPSLSLSGRSCAGCHNPAKAYTDGLTKNTSLQRDEQILRNTPTLLNCALQPFLFYDTRAASLEQQAHDVLRNRDEMDGNIEKAISRMNGDAAYRQAFREAFPGQDAITQQHIIDAIAAFERSLVKLDAPFDRYMRGDSKAMNTAAIKGFNLFMGKAKCGTCHYMPLFNGVVPPFYRKEDTEIIGVTAVADAAHPSLDADPGAYNYFHNEIKRSAFKTPSLRNISLTAPYMHNGAFATLEQVINFYDKGGAAGMGLRLENQTLPPDPLHLSEGEKKALIAFLKTLNDP